MPSLLIHQLLRWLGHAHRMEPDRIEILYGSRTAGGSLSRGSTAAVLQGRHQATPVHWWTSPNTEIRGGKVSKRGFQRRKRTLESRLHASERRGKNAQPLRAIPQGTSAPLPFQDRATQSYKILPKSPALTIASSRRGCHYRPPAILNTSKGRLRNFTTKLNILKIKV